MSTINQTNEQLYPYYVYPKLELFTKQNILVYLTFVILSFFTIKNSNIIVYIPYCILLLIIGFTFLSYDIIYRVQLYILDNNRTELFFIYIHIIRIIILLFLIGYPWFLSKYKC